MKKKSLFFSFCLVLFSFCILSSCDEESIDKVVLDPTIVGESIVRIQLQDTLIVRKGIQGYINKDDHFNFTVKLINEDYLKINLQGFSMGTFPANVNVANYYYSELEDFGLSIDVKRPDYLSGFIKIDHINKEAKVVNGNFKFKIFPPVDNEYNLRTFTIEGDFENLKYANSEKEYFHAIVNNKEFVNDYKAAKVIKDRIQVIAKNNLTEEIIFLNLPHDIKVGSHEGNSFVAEYHSPSGVVYKTYNDPVGNSIKINEHSGNIISADFSLRLKSNTGNIIEIKDGDFKLNYGI